MIHTKTIQLKNLFVLLIIPTSLAPFIVLWNEYMFYSFLYSSWVNCLWFMIVSYNLVAYYIVVKRNPSFLKPKNNKYIHWVFNILNSSLFLIYLKDINILSSVFYLIILILFMSCYSTKTSYDGVMVLKNESFLILMFLDPLRFLVYSVPICITKHLLLNDVASSIISHSLKYEQFTLLHSFTYEQYIYYIFYLEPISVIFTLFLVMYTYKGYFILSFESRFKNIGMSWFNIKCVYSAKLLFEIFILITIYFFVDILVCLFI